MVSSSRQRLCGRAAQNHEGMISLRTATLDDVTLLVALNHAAYPELIDGEIVGAIATLIVPASLALVPHTWADATADGTFRTHDPSADCLYLADVYVSPAAWGRGVAAALYRALFALCRSLELARVVAGARLFGYHEVRDHITPGVYVDEVLRGVRRDRVLGSQLRAGFVVHGIMRDYLHDWRSASFATLLAWPNPDLRVEERAPARICLV